MKKVKLGRLIEERSFRFITNKYIWEKDVVWVSKEKFEDIEIKCSLKRRVGWQETGYPQLEIDDEIYLTIPYRKKYYVIKR